MKGLRRLRDASAARCCSSDFFREAAAALRRAGGTKFVLPAPAAGAGRFSAGGAFAAFPKLSQLFLGGGGGGGGAAGVFGAPKRLNGAFFGAGAGGGAGAGVDVPVCSGVLVGFDRGRASAALQPSPVSSLAATGSASAILQRLISGSGGAAVVTLAH